jgi:hypothetical protein
MQQNELTPWQIRQQGLVALTEALGAVAMIRFLQQFDTGSGDYSREREQLLRNLTLAEVIAQIKQAR